jgi:hypothetical protein
MDYHTEGHDPQSGNGAHGTPAGEGETKAGDASVEWGSTPLGVLAATQLHCDAAGFQALMDDVLSVADGNLAPAIKEVYRKCH